MPPATQMAWYLFQHSAKCFVMPSCESLASPSTLCLATSAARDASTSLAQSLWSWMVLTLWVHGHEVGLLFALL